MNKKGIAPLILIVGGLFGGGFLLSQLNRPEPGSVESIIQAIPIWGWIILGFALVLIFRRR